MMRLDVPTAKRPLLFCGLVAVLALSILYNRSVRRAYLTDALRFLPAEDEALVATGDLESVWRGIDHHFGPVFRDEEAEAGALTEAFRELRDQFQEEGVRVQGLDDLRRHGVDPSRGLLVSGSVRTSGSPGLLALPVADPPAFTRFFTDFAGEEPDSTPPDVGPTDARLLHWSGDDVYLAVPGSGAGPRRGGMALLADDRDHLRRSLLHQERNLARVSADDALYQTAKDHLRSPLGVGPNVLASWRPQGRHGVEAATGVVTFSPEAVRVSVEAQLATGTLTVLDDLLAPPPPGVDWPAYLDAETAAALVFNDDALAGYVHFVERFAAWRSFMEDRYGGLLSAVQRVTRLRRGLVAVTGYRDGLPELLFGFWGDPEALGGLVESIQVDRREERDRRVLEAALDSLRARGGMDPGGPADGDPVPVDALRRAGLLVDEPDPTFGRYVVRRPENAAGPGGHGLSVDAAEMSAGDLEGATYRQTYRSATIRFLLPPVTDNDLKYVPELAGADPDVVRGDRYRMATVVRDSVLWVATNVEDLQDLIDRLGGSATPSDLSASAAFREARAAWREGDRIQGFLDVDRLTTLGLLSPESRIEDAARRLLLDLRNHPAVAFAVRPGEGEDRLDLDVWAILRAGLRDR